MVHVGMRDNDVAHLLTLFTGRGQRNAAGVNRNAPVDKKTGQTLFGSCVALTVKGAV
jgi:hypothetical protein